MKSDASALKDNPGTGHGCAPVFEAPGRAFAAGNIAPFASPISLASTRFANPYLSTWDKRSRTASPFPGSITPSWSR